MYDRKLEGRVAVGFGALVYSPFVFFTTKQDEIEPRHHNIFVSRS